MNFSYLEHQTEFSALYTACREAEEFALTKPDIGATSARKAMEFIVKYIYMGFEPYPAYGCTVYDMIRDPRFQSQFADPAMLNCIDYIRRTGNAAVHKGSLTAEDSMRVLENLHFLTGEFAVGIGLIDDYAPFEPPKLNPIREVIAEIHSDNFTLNIIPYLDAEGHTEWSKSLERCGKTIISNLYDLPDELICDEFFEFLKKFKISMQDEVVQLLELLPLSYATEDEWEQRRNTLSQEAIRRIECYIASRWMYGGYQPKAKWAEYSRILGSKASGYVWLVHPEILPHTIREGLVQKNVIIPANCVDAYISLDDAIQQIIRHISAESEEKRNNLTKIPWCKAVLGLPVAMLRNSKRGRENLGEKDSLYCKDSVHFGDRRYIYYIAWDRAQLMKLRSYAGKIGEELITMDSLADWGFAVPGSEAEKRALERAKMRKAKEEAVNELRRAEELRRITEESSAKAKQADADPEASPREIRSFIENELRLADCIAFLCSTEWCRQNLGFEHPVLISYEEGVYLRRKQMDGNYTYSRIQLEYARKAYFILRMKTSGFESFKTVIQRMGLRYKADFT